MQWCTFVVVTFIHVGPGSPIGLQSLYLFSGCSTERKISHCHWIHPILPVLNYPYTYIFHHILHSNSLMLKISSLSGLMMNRKANFFLIKANFICYLNLARVAIQCWISTLSEMKNIFNLRIFILLFQKCKVINFMHDT